MSNSSGPVNLAVEVEDDSSTTVAEGHIGVPQAVLEDGVGGMELYDQAGNLDEDDRWDYEWDSVNRLRKMTPTPAAVTAGFPNRTLEFVYDWQGRRIAKKVTEGWVVTHRRYLYEEWNVVAEWGFTGSGVPEIPQTYLWGLDLAGQMSGRLASLQGGGGVGGLLAVGARKTIDSSSLGNLYPGYDGNGNILVWIGSDGLVKQSRDYDSFGNVILENTDAAGPLGDGQGEVAYGFSTKPDDETSGLLYYGYRFYDPIAGRWIGRDRIEESGGVNLYAMVSNDAVGKYDYLGQVTLSEASHSLFVKGATPIVPASFPTFNNPYYLGPPTAPVFSPQQIFDEWHLLEKQAGEWWKDLPKCPRTICVRPVTARTPEFALNPNRRIWFNPDRPSAAEADLHPGTVWSLRSLTNRAGHANQCTYDKKGVLLRTPPGSGTVDWRKSGTMPHYYHDVDPVYLAHRLDGGAPMGLINSTFYGGPAILGVPGVNLSKYFEVRPLWALDP